MLDNESLQHHCRVVSQRLDPVVATNAACAAIESLDA